jgi:hypothetical protein
MSKENESAGTVTCPLPLSCQAKVKRELRLTATSMYHHCLTKRDVYLDVIDAIE